MKDRYPNPCETYTRDSCNFGGPGCDAWRVRYLYRQKQINAYARKAYAVKPTVVTKTENPTHFRYQHPDEVRRYLHQSPCAGCGLEKLCDTPCAAYIKWWDTRMKWFRREL